MNISNNTVLITGGSAGIGLALAKEFLKHNNTVIICGRNASRLEKARSESPELITVNCDIADDASVELMLKSILSDYPALNVLVNNAGTMHLHDVVNESLPLELQKQEIMTNVYGSIGLSDRLLSHFKKQKNAAIVNVTSGLAVMPFSASPVYAATKAAIHSYSMSMRAALKKTSVSIFEVLPPMVDTDLTSTMEMPGMKKLQPERLAKITLAKMKKNQTEIRPGSSAMMISMYRWFPSLINTVMNSMTPRLLNNLPTYK